MTQGVTRGVIQATGASERKGQRRLALSSLIPVSSSYSVKVNIELSTRPAARSVPDNLTLSHMEELLSSVLQPLV